jgi:hypothetical protein
MMLAALPLVFMVGTWMYLSQKMPGAKNPFSGGGGGGGGGGPLQFGKIKPTRLSKEASKVSGGGGGGGLVWVGVF